jgi:hypothetical protein
VSNPSRQEQPQQDDQSSHAAEGQEHRAKQENRSGTTVGLAFPIKKLFRVRRNRRNNWFVPTEFRLFRGTENSRNAVPNHSPEEKKLRNSVPWNKIKSKLSEFRSKPFSGRETNSKFRSWNKKRSKLSKFRSEVPVCLGQKHAVNSVCWSRIVF